MCCLCLHEEENLDRLFHLHCHFVANSSNTLFKEFGIAFCLPKKIVNWLLEVLDGISLVVGKSALVLCKTFSSLVQERNNQVIKDKFSLRFFLAFGARHWLLEMYKLPKILL